MHQMFANSVASPLPIVLVAGQSNAIASQANVSQAPSEPPDGESWFYQGDSNADIEDLWSCTLTDTLFGPELGASTVYNPAGYAKYAAADTNLYSDWQPGGAIYNLAIAAFDAAIADLVADSVDYSIPALIWMQGEADTDTSAHAAAYAANLTITVAALRAKYGAGMKIIVIEIGMSGTNADTVRAQQASFVTGDGNAALVETGDLSTTDGVHFNTASMFTIGERCAAEIP